MTAQQSILSLKKLLPLFILIGILFLMPKRVHAATFYISPAKATIAPGEVKTFSLHINTYGESINAVSSVIAYPSTVAEVTSITYGSVFTIQAEASYGGGAIRITRGTTGGASGDIIIANISVIGKAPGTASFRFASDSQAARASDSSNALDLARSTGTVISVTSSSPSTPTTPHPTAVSANTSSVSPTTEEVPQATETTNTHNVHILLQKENGDIYSSLPVILHPTDEHGTTDTTGTVTFSNLPSGSYTLETTIDNETQQKDFTVNDKDYVQNVTLVMSAKKTSFPLLPLVIILATIIVIIGVIFVLMNVRSQKKYPKLDEPSSSPSQPPGSTGTPL